MASLSEPANNNMFNGRATVEQDINTLRQNNPDILAAYGEFTDNSVSWGNAKNIGIFMEQKEVKIVDDGVFKDSRFGICFEKFKDPENNSTTNHYNNDENTLGKFNFGLTDSTMLLGDVGILICKFGANNFRKIIIRVRQCIENNDIRGLEEEIVNKDIEDFNKYQRSINSNYDEEEHLGTMLTIDKLHKHNSDYEFNELKKFMYGLYSEKCHNTSTIYLFNNTNITNITNNNEPFIIEPNDLTFGCPMQELKTIKCIYNKNDNKFKYKEKTKKIEQCQEEIYSFEIRTYFFDSVHSKKEKGIFDNNTDSERVGYQIRRGGRLTTGIFPKMWDISIGMNRAKGVRIIIDLPVNNQCDEHWRIGTFKKITEDIWHTFDDVIKTFIKDEFKSIENKRDSDIKNKQRLYQRTYEIKINNFNEFTNTMTYEEIKNEVQVENETLQNILNDKDDSRICKKAGNVYKTVTNYIKMLEKKCKVFEKQIKENEIRKAHIYNLIKQYFQNIIQTYNNKVEKWQDLVDEVVQHEKQKKLKIKKNWKKLFKLITFNNCNKYNTLTNKWQTLVNDLIKNKSINCECEEESDEESEEESDEESEDEEEDNTEVNHGEIQENINNELINKKIEEFTSFYKSLTKVEQIIFKEKLEFNIK